MTLPPDFSIHAAGQRIHHGDTHAVKTTGNRVTAAAKLTAGVQDGHHDFDGGLALGGVDVNGDAAAVVNNLDAAVGTERDFNMGAESGQSFIDRVIHHFIDQVVQTARTGGTDVHTGTLAYRFKALQDSDVAGTVLPGVSAGVSGLGTVSSSGSTAKVSALSLATGAFDSSVFDDGRSR